MGQTGAGEYGQLLAANQSVKTVNGGNTGLDKLCGVGAGGRVHRQTVDVQMRLGKYVGAAVYGLTHTVKDSTEHILAHGKLQRVTEEANLGLRKVDALCGLEKLNDCLVALDLKHLAAANLAVGKLYLGQLIVGNALDMVYYHKRACDLSYGFILFNHASSPPAMTSSISFFISAAISS